jgi:hypothetical protein
VVQPDLNLIQNSGHCLRCQDSEFKVCLVLTDRTFAGSEESVTQPPGPHSMSSRG